MRIIPIILLLTGCYSLLPGASPELEWPEPVMENSPGCYWWWMGSAVDSANITWNLETIHQAGIGGVTLVPIYGVHGWEDKFIPYLSPRWVGMMSYTVQEAKRLGMWVDMTTGTGWPFGGSMVSEADADDVVDYGNGKLSWRFTGQNVKRAAPGNEGRVLNPYSARAMADYLRYFDRAFARQGTVLPRAMYHDSFEYQGNWCSELPDEFKKLRGYDILEHLPELFGTGDPETVARIKSDYRETLSDLHLAYIETWVKWSNEKGCSTRNQAHGSPSNILDTYAASGIPETEIFGASKFKIPGIRRERENIDTTNTPQPLINRMASSSAHVTGKPLAAAETCTWLRNHFRTALSQAKPEIDQLFLCGINHIFFHGTCYSPRQAPWPGWLFYASMEYNPRNAIWRDAPLLNAYVRRCQSILQAGRPDNDVALYWPVYDIWHSAAGMQQQMTVHAPGWLTGSTCGKTAEWLLKNGYGFDYISDRQLLSGLGRPYKAVIVPRTGHIPLATVKKLLAMADTGQPVIFMESLPAGVPGFNRFSERRAELKTVLRGREKLVTRTEDLRQRLDATQVVREPMADAGLEFIRRAHGRDHDYFVANMGATPVDGWIALGVPLASAVIMDPRSGQTGLATLRNGRKLYLQLLPGETRILRTFADKVIAGPKWPLFRPDEAHAITVTGRWQVSFIDGQPELPEPFPTRELRSWTVLGDKQAERFAGTARYRIGFDLPDEQADNWILDLGDVRESARVSINGRPAAALWSVPYRAPVGNFLRPGKNLLEVEVTNLSANRVRDLDIRKVDWKIFYDINFVNQNYGPFDASGWQLVPSGLLGPVRLIPVSRLAPD